MENNIDIKENLIYQLDKELLDILLKDRSSKKNIIWATDNYASRGYGYQEFDTITVESITGRNGLVIKPRIEKSKKEQQIRVKDKAEVFTPSWICNKMANDLDNAWFNRENVFNTENGQSWVVNHEKIVFSNKEGKTWQDYIKLKTMEISCGEAPYLVSRYDTVTGEWIDIENRIGMLDRKLRVVNENTETEVDWYKWVVEAYKATFGFEWQGDSLLIARENLLFTFIDYYGGKFKKNPENEILIEIANILSWNIFQMDGLKFVIPNSCKPTPKLQISFFEEDTKMEECMACKRGNKHNHTGIYCKIKNWNTEKQIKFSNIKGENKMKFDFVIGNPPYQGENHQQIYPDFYIGAKQIGKCVELIFPVGWQQPKNANNLSKLNTEAIKADKQIVFIDNKRNVFQKDVTGAEWTNIILWKKGYDNGLNGKQLIYTNGNQPEVKKILWDARDIEKPIEIILLAKTITQDKHFESIQKITSVLKPYGLRTDVIKDFKKYGLNPLYDKAMSKDDIKIYCKSNIIKYVPKDYKFPKKSKALSKYKVFVPYAWGNMSEGTGLGGAFSDIIIANPYESCTETYLESGCFDDYETAKKHAKYLMTKFARALLYMNKNSQHSTTAWGCIPIQSYNESWWIKSINEINEKLFEKYNIPTHITEFTNKNIQTKNESNIVNFYEECDL